ncbi:hypothetical protein EW145_g5770 [Phellinidium pouzarii]|uniref:Uncharacterized protein n=1 Tax=Phellinidium pouzarii TaxID=167371 RepID=A0A4S4L3M9_9AGAM|nr:hypothetical protein EW145_g5770 [Phellinidium pouzarii]
MVWQPSPILETSGHTEVNSQKTHAWGEDFWSWPGAALQANQSNLTYLTSANAGSDRDMQNFILDEGPMMSPNPNFLSGSGFVLPPDRLSANRFEPASGLKKAMNIKGEGKALAENVEQVVLPVLTLRPSDTSFHSHKLTHHLLTQ